MKLLTGALIAVMLLILVGYITIQTTNPGDYIKSELYDVHFRPDVYTKRLPYTKAAGSHVCLVNYKNATDPAWTELISFLKRDDTDALPYINGSFVCADFAERLHNNAEAGGIKAAFVGVVFVPDEERGHALNAFNTTDRGLVYVDCTGEGFQNMTPHTQIFKNTSMICPHFNYSCDKIAYIMEGKVCGMINIDQASSLAYWYYEEYKSEWAEHDNALEAYSSDANDYNKAIAAHDKEVEAYEAAVGGRTIIIHDSDEYKRLERRYKALKAAEKELEVRGYELEARRASLAAQQKELGGYCWKPLGVVKDVKIYW